MAIRTVLTTWDAGPGSPARFEAAAALARGFGAHLDVLGMGLEPDIPPYAFGAVPGMMIGDYGEQAAEAAARHAAAAGEALRAAGVEGSAAPFTATYGALPHRFGARARFADLVVVSRPYGGAAEDGPSVDLLEGALFDGDAAVYVVPPGDAGGDMIPARIVAGWNDSREALRALRRALPFLTRAEAVELAVVDPSAGGQAPGEDAALMLARHGVKVEINPLPAMGTTPGGALHRRAVDSGAGLIVMGGYGHSRFRELVIGGATREMLEEATIPVLMAH